MSKENKAYDPQFKMSMASVMIEAQELAINANRALNKLAERGLALRQALECNMNEAGRLIEDNSLMTLPCKLGSCENAETCKCKDTFGEVCKDTECDEYEQADKDDKYGLPDEELEDEIHRRIMWMDINARGVEYIKKAFIEIATLACTFADAFTTPDGEDALYHMLDDVNDTDESIDPSDIPELIRNGNCMVQKLTDDEYESIIDAIKNINVINPKECDNKQYLDPSITNQNVKKLKVTLAEKDTNKDVPVEY